MDTVRVKELPYLKIDDKKITDDIYDLRAQGNPIEKLLQEQFRRWAKETDDYVFAQFERHGYSRDAIMALIDEGRVERKCVGEGNIYYIDGKELFSIARVYKDIVKIENGLYHTVIELYCWDAMGTRPIIE